MLGRGQPAVAGWEAENQSRESSTYPGCPRLYLELFDLLLQLTAQGLLILNFCIKGIQLKVLPVGKEKG